MARKKIKQKWDAMSKAKRFLILGIALLLVTTVTGAYFIGYEKSLSVDVIGGAPYFEIVTDFTDVLIDVDVGLEDLQSMQLINTNLDVDMLYNLETIETSLDPDCIIEDGDLTFRLEQKFEGDPNWYSIPDGSTFTIVAGENNFQLITTASGTNVCPSDVSATLTFTPV